MLAFGRALLEDNDRVHFVAGDLRRPAEVLDRVAPSLERDRPVALIQAATLHNVTDEYEPAAPQRQIEAYFDGLQLLEPGVVPLIEWWPTGPRLTPGADVERLLVGGVGREP